MINTNSEIKKKICPLLQMKIIFSCRKKKQTHFYKNAHDEADGISMKSVANQMAVLTKNYMKMAYLTWYFCNHLVKIVKINIT